MDGLRFFASDNNSGVHPRILAALAEANSGEAPAYGDDPWTARATESVKAVFGPTARPWFVLLGTAGNVLGLKSMARSHQGVICADTAHINCDECGAPEALGGFKLFPLPACDGKIRLEDCKTLLRLRQDVHHNYPSVLSITQSTECGTVYTLDELYAIRDFCREHSMYLHMDGARLANAAAALNRSLKEISADVGVDVLTFGGTKNGLMFGEAVIFFTDGLGNEFPYLRKQNMQLLSKMRYVAAQMEEYLKDGLWLENARAANRMTALLAGELQAMDHVRLVFPADVNALFVRMHKKDIAKLNESFYFYTLDTGNAPGFPDDWHMVRLMTSFNTTEEQVREFAAAIRACGV